MYKIKLLDAVVKHYIGGFFDLLSSLVVLVGFIISVIVDILIDAIFETTTGRWLFVIGVVYVIFRALLALLSMS